MPPQTLTEIRAHLGDARPRRRFGQNFMVEPDLVRRIADAGEIAPGDRVVEVGPGTGTLTEELVERGADVLAVEIDRDLAAGLRERFPGVAAGLDPALADARGQAPRLPHEGKITVIEGDAMAGKRALHPIVHEWAAGGAKLVANLPYNVASPLVVELLLAGCPLLAFTVQREVADRLAAEAGAAYGPLSVAVQDLATVEVLRVIPPTAFWPRPKIDSALVRLRAHGPVPADAREFAAFAAAGFGQRRKAVRNPLGKVVGADALAAVLAGGGVTGAERAEQVPLSAWRAMFAAWRGETRDR